MPGAVCQRVTGSTERSRVSRSRAWTLSRSNVRSSVRSEGWTSLSGELSRTVSWRNTICSPGTVCQRVTGSTERSRVSRPRTRALARSILRSCVRSEVWTTVSGELSRVVSCRSTICSPGIVCQRVTGSTERSRVSRSRAWVRSRSMVRSSVRSEDWTSLSREPSRTVSWRNTIGSPWTVCQRVTGSVERSRIRVPSRAILRSGNSASAVRRGSVWARIPGGGSCRSAV